MNKKGQIFLGLMFGVLFFILGLALVGPLQDVTGEATNDQQLNCTTTTDDQTKAVCTSIDIQQLFIAFVFGIAGVVISRSI